jgi:DNA-binding transcriptional regulator GbsR (MarR family)
MSSPSQSGVPDRVLPRVVQVADSVGAFIEAWGFRAIHGRVWALLMLKGAPLAQAEIAELLGVSRSLINLAVSELTEYGLVRPVGTTRNAPYEASLDIWPTITDVLRSREWMLVERARLALESLLIELDEAEKRGETSGFDGRRARVMLAMTELAQVTLRLFLAVRMPRSLAEFGPWLVRTSQQIKRLQESLPKLL